MVTKTNLLQPAYNSPNWDTPLNANFGKINNAFGGNLSLSITTDTVLTADQAQYSSIVISGLSTNTAIGFQPGTTGMWIVYNNTASRELYVYATLSAGNAFVTIKPGKRTMVYSLDGTNMYLASSDVVPLTGGTMTGTLNLPSNGFTVGTNQLYVSSGNVYTSGQFFAQSNVTAYNTSDARLKDNIETISNALSIVDKLRGVTFTSKKDGKDYVGLIAQELQEVLPNLVAEGEDGFLYVAYANIVAVLINAVQELSKKVEALENK